jgi:hypothetical protein
MEARLAVSLATEGVVGSAMTILAIVLLMCFALLSSKRFRGRLNPITLYNAIWAAILFLYSLELVRYEPLSTGSIVAVVVFAGILTASSLVGLAKNESRSPPPHGTLYGRGLEGSSHIAAPSIERRLRVVIVGCAVAAAIVVIPNVARVVGAYGPAGLVESMYQIYLDRESGNIGWKAAFGSVLPPLAFVGTLFAGIHLRRFGYHGVCILPITVALLHALSFGGRNSLVIPAICLLVPMVGIPPSRRRKTRATYWTMAMAGVFALLASLVNSAAAVATTITPYVSQRMSVIAAVAPGVSKAYIYLTAPLAVLNRFLDNPFELFGVNTLFPVYSQLDRFGFSLPIWRTLPLYEVPVRVNVGTYLMELWIDFSWLGAAVVVAALGFLAGRCWRRAGYSDSTVSNAVLTVLYLLLCLSFFMWYGRSVTVWILVMASVTCATWIDSAIPRTAGLAGSRGRRLAAFG